MAIRIPIVRHFVNFLLLFGISAMSCPGAHAQNMGDADFDASAYNLNAQLLAVSKKGDAERASALLSRGAAPNARNRNGETPLMLFARKGNGPMVRTLLEKGGDVNLPALDKTTPLMAAAYGGYVEVMTLLLDAGADPDAPDQGGTTPRGLVEASQRTELARAFEARPRRRP